MTRYIAVHHAVRPDGRVISDLHGTEEDRPRPDVNAVAQARNAAPDAAAADADGYPLRNVAVGSDPGLGRNDHAVGVAQMQPAANGGVDGQLDSPQRL